MYTDLGRPGGYICSCGRPSNLVIILFVQFISITQKSNLNYLHAYDLSYKVFLIEWYAESIDNLNIRIFVCHSDNIIYVQ